MAETTNTPRNREITVYLRESSAKQPARWETVERIAKILSAVAVPVVLAMVGFLVSSRLQDQTVRRDYVTLAVSVLQEPDPNKAPPEMKQWAVSLLDQNAPVKLPPQLVSKLQSGSALLPRDESLPTAGLTASPGRIRRGETVQLRWSATNASEVLISPEVGRVETAGARDVSPSHPTTYTIVATNPSGRLAAADVTVEVDE